MADFRVLPSVHEVLTELADMESRYGHAAVTGEIRRAIEAARSELKAGRPAPASIAAAVRESLGELDRAVPRRVINATGVVLHTNLGRAPLPAATLTGDYSNLEYDLGSGRRGRRDWHLDPLFARLLGVPALAVNNNAAAVYLALSELAAGGEVIVSRGELIEIGDSFRIPDIMRAAGAVLREVGATNRTRIEDYAGAINERTRLIMVVHPSNFRMEGFSGKPERAEIAKLGRARGIPVYEDLGSGCMADLTPFGVSEPRVREVIDAGVSLVSFSGDKLLGGPQAGVLAGNADLIARLRGNPMFRALRIDKLIVNALAGVLRDTLFERWDRIPALRMIRLTAEEIHARATELAAGLDAEVVEGRSVIGGGSTPEVSLPTWVIAIRTPDAAAAERRLRQNNPPVIARIEGGRVLVDLRTVAREDEPDLRSALLGAVLLQSD